MSTTSVILVQRRATLLLEEFLLSLGAAYVSSFEGDPVGFDYLAFFTSGDGSTRVVAIELKATEREIGGRFPLPGQTVRRAAGMNVPALLVVVDVKRSEVFYTWARDALTTVEDNERSVPLRLAGPEENAALLREIFGSTAIPAREDDARATMIA